MRNGHAIDSAKAVIRTRDAHASSKEQTTSDSTIGNKWLVPGVGNAARNTKGAMNRWFPAVIRTFKTVIRGEYKMRCGEPGFYFFSTCAPGVTWMLFVVSVVPVAR